MGQGLCLWPFLYERLYHINKEGVRTGIYNLQGQRLSSLQKGLNIVNGKKVYVK